MASQVFGVIAPHPPIFLRDVGGQERHAADASLTALAGIAADLEAFDPQTIVVMSPHAPAFADAFAIDGSPEFEGSMERFGDRSSYVWAGDPELARAIMHELTEVGLPVIDRNRDARLGAGDLDHGVIVPLSLVDPCHERRIVVISLSDLDYDSHRRLGTAVRTAVTSLDRRAVFLASGDLSHRLTPEANAGYSPRARELDAAIVGRVEQGRLAALMHLDPRLIEAGGECGLRSIIAVGGYCCEDPAPARLLSYEGPWGVGYLTALVGRAAVDLHLRTHAGTDEARYSLDERPECGSSSSEEVHFADESEIVRLARTAITAYLTGEGADAEARLADATLPTRAGTFISLHRHGELRGCIGTIEPTKDALAHEVVANAIEAAVNDPRFEPMDASELFDLDVKVDVLHEPEPATPTDLDPAVYGVIVTSGRRRGLLLPDLEGVDDVQTQLAIALRKAGISPDEQYMIERFKVDRYT